MNFIADFLGMNEPGYESSTDMNRGQNAGAKKRKVGRPKKKKVGRPRKVGRPKGPKKVKTKRKSKKGGSCGFKHMAGGYGMEIPILMKKGGDISTRHFYGMPHSKIAELPDSLKIKRQVGKGVDHPRHAYGMAHKEVVRRFPQKGGLGIKEIKKIQKKLAKLYKELEKAKVRRRIEIRKQIKGTEKVLKRLIGGAKKKRGPGRPKKVGRPKKKKVSGYYSI